MPYGNEGAYGRQNRAAFDALMGMEYDEFPDAGGYPSSEQSSVPVNADDMNIGQEGQDTPPGEGGMYNGGNEDPRQRRY